MTATPCARNALFPLLTILAISGVVASAQQRAESPAGEPLDSSSKQDERSSQAPDDRRKPGLKGWISRRIEAMNTPSTKREKHVTYFGGIIVAGSGLAAGVGYQHPDLVTDRIDFEAEGSISVRRYQYYRAAIGRLRDQGSTLEFDTADASVPSLFNASARKAPGSAVYLDVRFRDYPQHSFYGTGIDSLREHETDYLLRGVSLEGVWQRQLTSALGLSARGGWLDLEVGAGHDGAVVNLEDRFPLTTVPGALQPPGFLTFGIGLAHDTRSAPGAPEDGHMVGVSLRRFAAHNAPDLSFTRVTVEARAYQRPLTERGVVAARALLSDDLTGDTGATPFYLQATLGGSETLRSYHSYRFRDHAIAHGTVEYRWRAHRFVELVPFFDVGTVGRGFSHLAFGSLKTSRGIGFRVRTNRRALGRLDWAWGGEGQRVVFGVGPAF
jgi:hypothetical protein